MTGHIGKPVWGSNAQLAWSFVYIKPIAGNARQFIKIKIKKINMKKILVSILISGLLVNPFLVLGQYGNANDQGQKFELSQKINSDLQIKNQMDLGLAAKTNASAIKNKANADLQKQNYVPGEILVKFKSSKVNLQTAGGRTAALNFSHAKLLEKKEDLGKNNISVLTIKDAKTVEQKITELKNDPNVEYAEPNYKRYPAIIDTDDTYKTNLWGLDNIGQTVNTVTGINDADIDAPEAWAINEGANGQIIVAVIDSGVAYNHPDLVANMWDGSNCKDEDGNVLGGCQHGFDYEDNDKMPLPTSSSHGMYIAGTIAAAKNNDKGIIGVAPNARIMAIKFGLDIASEIKAIDFAIQNGAKIINASFGGDTFSQFEYDAINRFKSAGGIFVAAAGNGGLDQIGDNNENTHHYPSDYNLDNIISVAATDQNDNLAPFSNYGANSIDVAAPGTNIYSTIADSPVMFENFESIATPDVPSGWIKGGTNNKWATYNFNDNVWGKVMYGQVPSFPYDNNANTTITSPTYDLIAGEASMDFWTKCDTEYITTGWADYMQLEYSADGVNFFPAIDPFFGEEFRWDEPTLDLLNGENPLNNTNGSIFHYENVSIPAQYLTNNFKFQFRWVTNASDNNYDGCLVDDIKITKFSDGSDEKYGYANGTSMAAPHVAGLAALIWGYRPDLTLPQVRDVILNTGDLLPSLDGKTFTGKRINAQKALQSVAPISLTSIAIATPATKLTYAVGDSLDISGLTVIGTYSDNSTTTETITATNITGFD
ncbi:MAG: S8 family serine peptidase, partial [Candidatus Gastranaerophilales bacterium]|nr:S8 family serine peptidase [Candidatus Gastranaerophilales bacterium]